MRNLILVITMFLFSNITFATPEEARAFDTYCAKFNETASSTDYADYRNGLLKLTRTLSEENNEIIVQLAKIVEKYISYTSNNYDYLGSFHNTIFCAFSSDQAASYVRKGMAGKRENGILYTLYPTDL